MYCEKCGRSVPDGVSVCLQCSKGSYSVKPAVGMGEAVKLFFANYTNFSGRSRRSEFWWVILFNCLVSGLLAYFLPLLSGIWALIVFIPGLALCIRRLHDAGKSGWAYFINCIPLVGQILYLVWICSDSQEDNQWGKNPKVIPNAVPITVPERRPAAPAISAPAADDDYPETAYSPPPTFYSTPTPVVAAAPSFSVTLLVCTGVMAGQQLTFPAGKTFTMGRSASRNEVALEQYGKVSGVHCRVSVANQQMTVTDLNSTNGTYVNGKRLNPNQPISVTSGSTIFLADSGCAFQVRFN